MKLRKRGGQPDYCRDRQGNLIVGLSCNACDGRFYATHSKPRKWFGRDFDLALIRFREWEAQTTGQRREVILSRRALTPEESALLSAAGEENLPSGITYAKEGEVKVESEHGVESAPRVTGVEVRERVAAGMTLTVVPLIVAPFLC